MEVESHSVLFQVRKYDIHITYYMTVVVGILGT